MRFASRNCSRLCVETPTQLPSAADFARVFDGEILLADVDTAAPAMAAMSGRSLTMKRTPRGAENVR